MDITMLKTKTIAELTELKSDAQKKIKDSSDAINQAMADYRLIISALNEKNKPVVDAGE